ncbi:amino acid permease [Bacillus pseudomycoides]|uniref:amino acid permease n=1 Tax=Bacillus pseudomycoides TaxID=64104 RepID=UPI000BF04282|nr:amino acid permease [Bacillus pseudomycoides]PEI50018.1 amino acid permease [Bacillus pseudomycoides]PGA72028.1 amino acid permease [Bacillus pseudomycoides]PHE04501.1 amino acid permease [Bacillus pseudomycoides]PHE99645.1 amino acid permease [Bacillus pseudomycoides]
MHTKVKQETNNMQQYHYKQELKRSLKFFSSFAVAFSFMSITTGIFTNFGFVLNNAGPAGIWTWPIVLAGHLLVALVIAELAGRMPLSGYSYQWVTRLANQGLGWFSGWNIGGKTLLYIVLATLLLQAVLNIFGVKLASRLNDIAVYTEVIGMVGILVILAIVALFTTPNWDMLTNIGEQKSGTYLGGFVIAMLMGSWTMVGFEAAANLSEETIDASKNVPRAVFFALLIGGIIGFAFLFTVTISISDLADVTASVNPLPLIIKTKLGQFIGTLFMLLVIISIFACGLIGMASASRIIYAMARDDVFFASRYFKKVNPRTSVPVNAIVLVLVLDIIASLFSDSLTLLVGSTSVVLAALYFITVLAYYLRRKDLPDAEAFNLGKWRAPVTYGALIWLVFEMGILTIPDMFHEVAIVGGTLFLTGTLVYFALFRSKIKSGKIGIQNTNIDAGHS